jgi:hypothetical protein
LIDGIIGPQQLSVEPVSGLDSPQHSGLENSGLEHADLHNLQVADAPLDRPTAAQAADFARAAADATAHGAPTHDIPSIREVQATHPSAGHWTDSIARQMKDLESSLKFSDPAAGHAGGTSPAGAPRTLEPDKATTKNDALDKNGSFEDGIAQLRQVYAFTVKATMVSHGSSEATKVFNTLLKGN